MFGGRDVSRKALQAARKSRCPIRFKASCKIRIAVEWSQYLAVAGGCEALFSTVRGSKWPRLKLRLSADVDCNETNRE